MFEWLKKLFSKPTPAADTPAPASEQKPELLESCKPLGEYAWLVNAIRKSAGKDGVDSVVDRAISEMPDDFEIKPFLDAHRAEVKGMLMTEYDETEAMELFRMDGIKEGLEEGTRTSTKI